MSDKKITVIANKLKGGIDCIRDQSQKHKRAANIERIRRKKEDEQAEHKYELDEIQFTHNTNVYMDATSQEEKLKPLDDLNLFTYGVAGLLASIVFWNVHCSTQMFKTDNLASYAVTSAAMAFSLSSIMTAFSNIGELRYSCSEQADMILRIMKEQGYAPTQQQRAALYKELIAMRSKPKAWFISLGKLVKKDPKVLTQIHSVTGFDKFLLNQKYAESMVMKYIPVKSR